MYVAQLETVDVDDRVRVGGKGANLGELRRLGHRVPDGFVVTTDAYDAVLKGTGLLSGIRTQIGANEPDAEDAAWAAIRSDIATVTVPDPVERAIVDAYTELGGGPVAVRSSATAEDAPGATLAGQHDTFLNVIGADAVLDAVRRCWASLWTDRAVAYRRRRGISTEQVRMAVVVQAMVPADSAGVLFTANPITGARDEVVVDASSGLGEAVVSGLVTPDHYVLDAHGEVREWTQGRREVIVRGAPGGGVTRDTTSTDEARRLPGEILVELAGLGVGIADHFGQPQDIEWACTQGRVWVLQARPMTALPPPPAPLTRIQRRTGPPILEMLPIRPYPLDISGWIEPGLGRMVSRMLDELAGLRVDLAEALPEVDGVVDRFVPPAPHPTPRVLTAPARNLRRIRRHDPAAWEADPRFAAFEQQVRTLAARDLPTTSWDELSRLPRRALHALHITTELRVDYLPAALAALLRLRLILMLLGRTELFRELILGAPTRTTDANRELAAMASRVRADDTLRALFADVDAYDLVRHLDGAPELREFRVALDAFLDAYGHRETTSVLLVSSLTWSDDPATVLGAITALVEQPHRPTSGSVSAHAVRRLLNHPVVRLTRSQARLTRMVQAARTGIALREDTHFHATRVLPIMRRVLLEMGRRLAYAAILADQGDVFHLRLGELEGLPDPLTAPEADAARIRRAVRARAARREQFSGAPLISPAVLFPDSAGHPDALVVGVAVGGGQATGPVRVIRQPKEFGTLRSGDVLVCPYTNPSWTSLFQRAAAVVVDTGGPTSHAAIVAREYGIPAVMGAGTATTSLTNGQMVTVDGDHGHVTIAADKTTPPSRNAQWR